MKPFAALVVPAVLLGACATSRENLPICGDHGTLLSQTTHVTTPVALEARPAAPSLYLISGHYVILMPPSEVVSLLQARVGQLAHAREDETLLAAIQAKWPITEDTDLLKFSFRNRRLFERPAYIAADLLEAGAASVVDLWGEADEGREVASIVAMRLQGAGTWRDFCEPTGESILFVTDSLSEFAKSPR